MPDEIDLTKPPDWVEVGEQLAQGLAKQMVSSDLAKFLTAIFVEVIGGTASIAMTLLSPVGLGFAKGITKASDLCAPAYAEFAAAAVADVFNVDVSAASFTAARGRGARDGAGAALGKGLIQQITGSATNLQPDDTAASKYVGTMARIAIEDWYKGWFFEVMSSLIPELDIGKIETFGGLGDKVVEVLGLGRISRRVLSPIVDASIVTPLEWKVNKTYRPKLLTTSIAVKEFHRGRLTREQLDEELARQGWGPARIEALVNDAKPGFSDAQLKAARAINIVDDALAIEKLRDNGWDPASAAALTTQWKQERIYAYADREVTLGIQAFRDRDITNGELNDILGHAIPNDDLRAAAKHFAELAQRLNVRRLSHAEVKEAVVRGILAVSDYRRWLTREGYDPDDALTLELLLQAEIRGQHELEQKRRELDEARAAEKAKAEAERKAKAAAAAEKAARTFPALVDLKRAVVRGILPIEAYADRLAELKYAAADAAFLVELVAEDREAYLAALERRAEKEGEVKQRGIALGDLEAAVLRGIISVDDYRRRLEAEHISPADAGILVSLVEGEQADRAAAARKRDEATARLAQKDLSLAQVEKAVRQHLTTPEDYRAFLLAHGFAPEEAALLVASLTQDMAEAAADAQRRAAVNAKAKARGIPLAEIERAVKLGVRTRAAYQAKLALLEVSPEDQTTLLGILDVELAQLAAAKAKREAPPPAPEPPGVSRGDVEKAVRAGVATLADYREWLAAAGYSADDQDLLVGLLTVEVQRLEAARQKREAPPPAPEPPGITRAELERAVRAGVRVIADYAAWLEAAGYSADDADLLVALLASELARLDEARARREALDEERSTRELARADLERAVKAGLATIEDYVAFLDAQGYRFNDAALLVALLESELSDT